MVKYLRLIKERFPIANWIFIGLLWSAVQTIMRGSLFLIAPIDWLSLPILLLFFLHLRLLDDLKDFKGDRLAHPERPLPAGWINEKELKGFVLLLLLMELTLVLIWNAPSLTFYAAALAFSLLMYLEFFIPEWLDKHILVYFWSHSLITPILVLFIMVPTHSQYPPEEILITCVLLWIPGLWFEITRKTFALDQEAEGKDSYTKALGWRLTNALIVFLTLASLFWLLLPERSIFLGGIYQWVAIILPSTLGFFALVMGFNLELYSKKQPARIIQALGALTLLLYFILIIVEGLL